MSWDNLPFDSKEEAFEQLKNQGLEDSEAERLAAALEEEVNHDEGQPETLWESIKQGARNVIDNLNLETFSWVENPAQRSNFVMFKDDGEGYEVKAEILKESKEDDWEIAYAPVMVPGEIDKDEEAIPSHVIERSAHEFLAEGRVNQIDSDHDLITGKGTLVESWILKEDKDYVGPDGETHTYPKGTWMAGVKPKPEIKERIEAGEIQGYSIFGEAEKIDLVKRETFKMKENENNSNEVQSMSNDQDFSPEDFQDDMQSVKEGIESLKEKVSEPEIDAKEVSTVEGLISALKDDEELVELGFEEKQATAQELIDVIGTLTPEGVDAATISQHTSQMLEDADVDLGQDQVENEEQGEHGDEDEEVESEDDDYDKDEMEEEETEKANLGKGADQESVREENLEQKSEKRKSLSYKGRLQA